MFFISLMQCAETDYALSRQYVLVTNQTPGFSCFHLKNNYRLSYLPFLQNPPIKQQPILGKAPGLLVGEEQEELPKRVQLKSGHRTRQHRWCVRLHSSWAGVGLNHPSIRKPLLQIQTAQADEKAGRGEQGEVHSFEFEQYKRPADQWR